MATRKVTVTLDEAQVDAIPRLVESGSAASISGFVQHTVSIALDDVAGWGRCSPRRCEAQADPSPRTSVPGPTRRWATGFARWARQRDARGVDCIVVGAKAPFPPAEFAHVLEQLDALDPITIVLLPSPDVCAARNAADPTRIGDFAVSEDLVRGSFEFWRWGALAGGCRRDRHRHLRDDLGGSGRRRRRGSQSTAAKVGHGRVRQVATQGRRRESRGPSEHLYRCNHGQSATDHAAKGSRKWRRGGSSRGRAKTPARI